VKTSFCHRPTGARQFGREVLCGKPTHGATVCPAHPAELTATPRKCCDLTTIKNIFYRLNFCKKSLAIVKFQTDRFLKTRIETKNAAPVLKFKIHCEIHNVIL